MSAEILAELEARQKRIQAAIEAIRETAGGVQHLECGGALRPVDAHTIVCERCEARFDRRPLDAAPPAPAGADGAQKLRDRNTLMEGMLLRAATELEQRYGGAVQALVSEMRMVCQAGG